MRIAGQLAEALAVVHKHGLIHRDLKPANILLQDDGTLKLLDFGIARARDEAGITQHGMLVGTVLYMSPEQVRGDELDYRSDIFSLGGVLYNVMTGSLPFPGDSFPEVCMAILDGQPRPPSKVRSGFPKPLEEFLLTCMAPDSDKRYQTAVEARLRSVSPGRRSGRAFPPGWPAWPAPVPASVHSVFPRLHPPRRSLWRYKPYSYPACPDNRRSSGPPGPFGYREQLG